MRMSFGMRDVTRWAQFSGDFNPIHFQKERAALLGQSALIVHGMLALLPVKLALTKEYMNGGRATKEWMKFRAMFRTPVPHNETIVLKRGDPNNGQQFQVCSAGSGSEYFRGSYTSTNKVRVEELGKLESACSVGVEEISRFAKAYPQVALGWIALDAIIFSAFMHRHMAGLESLANRQIAQMHGHFPVSKLTLQVNHTVTFDPSLLKDNAIAGAQLCYDVIFPSFYLDRNQCMGTVFLPVMLDGMLVMVMEVGLIVKVRDSN
jgi:hypothetical protein